MPKEVKRPLNSKIVALSCYQSFIIVIAF